LISGNNFGYAGDATFFNLVGAGYAGVQTKHTVYVSSSTALGFIRSGTAGALTGADILNTTEVDLFATVPISGWSSNTVLSQDTDTRVVAASATQNFAGAAVVTGTTLKWTSNITQTHGTYDSSTGIFTAPVSGFYEVSAIVGWYSSADCQIALSLQKNGSGSDCQFKARNNATNNVCNHLLERLIYLNANDNIRVIITVDAGAATYISASDSSAISIKRLSGPATIAASEFVGASFTGCLTTLSSGGATLVFPGSGKIYDSHGAMNTSTGIYTVPVSGKYSLSCFLITSLTTGTNSITIEAYQTGSTPRAIELQRQDAKTGLTSSNGRKLLQGDATFNCMAGDTLYVTGYDADITSSTAGTRLSITRIG